MYSAHWLDVHPTIVWPGERSILCPKVVGVGSVEGGSESVGDSSSSVGSIGEVSTLRSYSSSASESSYTGESWYMGGIAILMERSQVTAWLRLDIDGQRLPSSRD